MKLCVLAVLPCIAIVAMTATTYGDEGMWLFNNPPTDLLKKRYGFEPTPEWLEHVQKASVRFNSGGSGSFVSPDGLVMTNHHVGAGDLQKLSTEKNDYLRDGFAAKTRADELKCKGLELNVLMSIEDVTERVNAAVKPGTSDAESFAARRTIMAEIEKESLDKTGLRSDVVTLYNGGQYHLYRFKKYTDIRLVFAPEQQIAFFGGDPDNFEYPRYDLDVCFFRVYENDQPAKIEHYLNWSKNGAKEGELVLVSGHPGRTNRQNTVAELEYLRDKGYPYLLQRLNRMEVNLGAWSNRTEENSRRAKDDLFGVQNSRKARVGGLAGLLDPTLFGRKIEEERQLREAVAKNSELEGIASAWDVIATCEQRRKELIRDVTLLENGSAFNSSLFHIAHTLVRAAEEKAKPNGERLREFADSRLQSLELELFSDEPIYPDYETIKLADSLTFLANERGVTDELVQKVLAGKSPRQRAYELVAGSQLAEIPARKKLYEGGAEAILASKDSMIALAKLIDPAARKVREAFETEVDEPKRQAHARIAKARYAVQGASNYPDATFTLRLAFGTVKGYEQDGKTIAPFTDYAGMYTWAKEHNYQPPFDLTPRWMERKDKLDLKTPLNFVCTADIIGGNSGSPVINKNAEVVGLIFDGNIQSLVLDFIYTDEQARAVSVCSQAIVEALRKVYDAQALADELTR